MYYSQRWWHLAAIQIGGVICLPIFVIGHAVAVKYGLTSALFAVVFGNLILLILGCISARYSTKTRMTTTETAAATFGTTGQKAFAYALTFAMVGWFALQLDLMAISMGGLLNIGSTKMLNLLIGVTITVMGLKGIRSIELLANATIPLMLCTIGYALWNSSTNPATMPLTTEISLGGISLVIAASIGAVIDMPTFFRFAKTKSDALLATIVLFGISLPLLEGVGVYFAFHGGGDNIIESLMSGESSVSWKIWIASFILMAGWTTNNANLYSAAMSLKGGINLKNECSCLLICGIAGTMLSMLNLEQNLFFLLEAVGVVLAAAGGAMVIHQLSNGSPNRTWKGASFALGTATGGISLFVYPLTGINVLDAFIASFICAGIGALINTFKPLKEVESEIYEIC